MFRRLWENQGLPEILHRMARGRRFGFDPEWVSFAMALQRLCYPGPDLQDSGWIKRMEALSFEAIELPHFYWTIGFLAEVPEELEREFFDRDRDLFTQPLDLVFIGTTSIYVSRAEETEWRVRDYSRDNRADLTQLVLAVAVDRQGLASFRRDFPGNTFDHKALEAMLQKMRECFSNPKGHHRCGPRDD